MLVIGTVISDGGLPGMQNSNVGGYSSKGFVEVLAASQSPTGSRWFQGTADAVRQYLWLFEDAERNGVEDFIILSGTCSETSPWSPWHDILLAWHGIVCFNNLSTFPSLGAMHV